MSSSESGIFYHTEPSVSRLKYSQRMHKLPPSGSSLKRSHFWEPRLRTEELTGHKATGTKLESALQGAEHLGCPCPERHPMETEFRYRVQSWGKPSAGGGGPSFSPCPEIPEICGDALRPMAQPAGSVRDPRYGRRGGS